MKMPRTPRAAKLSRPPPRRSPVPVARKPSRYLRDVDVLHAAAITMLAVLVSAGLVWLGYLVHVWRIATRSAVAPPRRMTVLVFGRRLEHDAPGHDYRQRLQRALLLARGQQTDHLLLLGGCSGSRISEAAAGEAWLRRHDLAGGVRVELEQDSVDSLENLRHARRLLLRDGRLPPVALVTNRYHLARCLLLARRLGFDSVAIAAEPALPTHARYLGRLVLEAGYLMWIDIGMRWARLIGHARMAARIS